MFKERNEIMQYVNRYNLEPMQATAFREWLLENATELAKHAPEGWTYLGTWFTVLGFGHYACETRWELDDYAALGSGFGDEAFQKLFREWMAFTDQRDPGETYLLKSADDVSVFE
jgi:hypothetical protein